MFRFVPARLLRQGSSSALAVGILVGLAALAGCHFYQLERKLGPAYADFYYKVQPIMTSQERKIFLELPDSERDKFIEDFWERRNPTPGSKENAFRMEYNDRVRMAAQLFAGEGKPGYLTDRGRIYILFGPPSERLTYPMDAESYCREVWYYGAFPVIFVDEHCSGNYLLTAINLQHLQEINIAQGNFEQTFSQDKKFFDYDVSVVKNRTEGRLLDGKVQIRVPYAGIWFASQGERLETSLEVRLEAEDMSGVRLWETAASYPLAMSEDELKGLKDNSYRIEIPMVIEKGSTAPKDGTLRLLVHVKNTAEDEELKKILEIRLEP